MAAGLSGLIYLLPLTLALFHPGRAYTRHVIAIGQMLTPSLFIFLTGRGFETHFFIFGALASLAAYRDIKILMTATLAVALDDRLGQWVQTIFFAPGVHDAVDLDRIHRLGVVRGQLAGASGFGKAFV